MGTTFYAPPWILDDTEVTSVNESHGDIPHHIYLATSARRGPDRDVWTFRAVERGTDYAPTHTEWLCIVAPNKVVNHEAVVYLFPCDSDGEIVGAHHEVYAEGIETVN